MLLGVRILGVLRLYVKTGQSIVLSLDIYVCWKKSGPKKQMLEHAIAKYEPRHKKTCLRDLRPAKTQTGLRCHRN